MSLREPGLRRQLMVFVLGIALGVIATLAYQSRTTTVGTQKPASSITATRLGQGQQETSPDPQNLQQSESDAKGKTAGAANKPDEEAEFTEEEIRQIREQLLNSIIDSENSQNGIPGNEE